MHILFDSLWKKKIDILIIIDAFSSERYIKLLLDLLRIPIINIRFDSINAYNDLPKKLKSEFYKCRYPEKWEYLNDWTKKGVVGLFHGVWTHEPRDRRVMKEEYLGLNARIYNILYKSRPNAYLIGFEPYTDTFPFDYNLYMRHIDHIIEAKNNGYNNSEIYLKYKNAVIDDKSKKEALNLGTYLFLKGEQWIIPYTANKSFKTLICGEIKNNLELYQYDVTEYCEKLMYYNQFDRPFNFHTNKFAKENIYYDCCNDCALDSYIIENYCKKYKKSFWQVWNFINDQLKNELMEFGHGFLFPNRKDILPTMYRHESALISNSRFTGL